MYSVGCVHFVLCWACPLCVVLGVFTVCSVESVCTLCYVYAVFHLYVEALSCA